MTSTTNQNPRRPKRFLGVAIAATLALTFGFGGTVGAAEAAEGKPSRTDWAALEAQAARDGHVPVVVSLRPPTAATTRQEARADHYRGQQRGVLDRFNRKQPKALKALDAAPFLAMHADPSDLKVLQSADEVAWVSVDEVHEAAGTVNNGDAAGQQLPSMWDYGRIGADWANNNGWTGRGQSIVVIDTGVDRSNPYLSGRVTNEACFATNADGTGACGGGTYSYSTSANGVPGAAAPCNYNAWSCSHGTHVAHTAAGAYGVARGARIIAIQASHPEWDSITSAWKPSFSDSDLGNALWYVHYILPKAGIIPAAVNMSVGGGFSPGTCDNSQSWATYYINALKYDYQIPTVVASGNDNYLNGISSPACNSNAISVGNTTMTTSGVDAVFGYTKFGSNSSSTLKLLAPGTDICSAVPSSLDNFDGVRDGWTCGWNGTSMAAPHVAGAIAILSQKRPTASVDQLLGALQRSGSTGGVAVTDSRNNVTRTRINVANAVYYF